LRRWSSANKKTLVAVGVVMMAMFLSLTWHLITRPPRERRVYNRGLNAMNREDYYEAIKYFDEAFQLKKDEPAIRLARGRCHQKLKDHGDAHKDYMEIGKGECDAIVKEVYAYSFFALKAKFRAAVPYSQLVKRDPEDIQMRVNLAFANYDLTNQIAKQGPSRALQQANDILEIDGTCQAAHQIRAMSMYSFFFDHQHGNLNNVLDAYEKAIAMGRSNPHLELGRLKVLAKIAESDPSKVDAFIAEMKSQLEVPQFNRQMLDSPLFELIENEPWFVAAKAQCPAEPVPEPMIYITKAPSDKAIQEYLERPWDEDNP
jgi:tetratricopeptide (TPR) repeat protein